MALDLDIARRAPVEGPRDQLAALQKTLAELDRLGNNGRRQRDELTAEIARLRAEIAETDRRLAEARQAADRRSRSYAVVPYRGSQGTYRRPIYVECRSDSIVLQPEGVVLTEDDFEGPTRLARLDHVDVEPVEALGGLGHGLREGGSGLDLVAGVLQRVLEPARFGLSFENPILEIIGSDCYPGTSCGGTDSGCLYQMHGIPTPSRLRLA